MVCLYKGLLHTNENTPTKLHAPIWMNLAAHNVSQKKPVTGLYSYDSIFIKFTVGKTSLWC